MEFWYISGFMVTWSLTSVGAYKVIKVGCAEGAEDLVIKAGIYIIALVGALFWKVLWLACAICAGLFASALLARIAGFHLMAELNSRRRRR